MNMNKEENTISTIKEYERIILGEGIHISHGNIPVLISVPHSKKIITPKGVKLNEPYTKAIALYLSEVLDVHVFINTIDTGIDPNINTKNYYTASLIEYIKNNNIKLVLDLHGARLTRNFDIDLGTLYDNSAKERTINLLKESLNNEGIDNVTNNKTFPGGGITKIIHKETDVEVIQLEINKNYRVNNEQIEKVANGLIKFINNY